MMPQTQSDLAFGYADGRAVTSAIKSAARAFATGDNPSVNSLIQQTTYDRFLCRVFSSEGSSFILKGGTGMLARIRQARTTRDIDLTSHSCELDEASTELIKLASVDLGDHFRFVLVDRTSLLEGDNQPYTAGTQLKFDVYIGATRHGAVSIDLAVGHTPTGQVEKRPPVNRLALPRLKTYDYVLYPITDQIADKACATLATYGSEAKPSSREKDLIDLVSIALHETIDAHDLAVAIKTEMILRKLNWVSEFSVPAHWGFAYSRLARSIAFLSDYQDVTSALQVARALLDPILNGSVKSGKWAPESLGWK
jgi:hypothetical protein